MDESLRLPPRLAAILEDLPLEELAFVPVPVKPRSDGWTPARQLAFILRLALLGGVAAAAKAVGMSRESAYRLRGHPARRASPPPGTRRRAGDAGGPPIWAPSGPFTGRNAKSIIAAARSANMSGTTIGW
ncbi:MAG TPA: hypothetical protein VD846_08535 [Allosphingosinicella sp.]|nr:hypothetical protein [Allosphingosinicella sp.]